jgi:hypothetical protein
MPERPPFINICPIDGGIVIADDTLFPGVIGTGISMLMGFLGVGYGFHAFRDN